MDVYEAIYGRKSIRSFDAERNVPKEIVTKLLQAACQAPSAGNLQPWRFLVATDVELKEKLAEAALGQRFLSQAPVVVVVCIDLEVASRGYRARGTGLYGIQDTAAATQNLLLAAYAEGLGSCWVGAFDEQSAADVLSLSSHLRPVAMVPVGYPDHERQKPAKREVSEVTEFL